MRILALDMGEKRIGIALSDAMRITAQGLEVIHRTGNTKDLARIGAIIKEYEVSELVLGYPKNMDGSIGEKCELVDKFATLLQEQFPQLKLHLWDERLSTSEAQKLLISADMRRDKRKQVVDKMAAGIILQGFLSRFC